MRIDDAAVRISSIASRLGFNKALAYRAAITPFLPSTSDSISLLGNRYPFLILSTGRTGTQWLAELLNLDPAARVVHEPVPDEQFFHRLAISDPSGAGDYLRNFRIREMALRIKTHDPAIYGEVNSALRRHAREFKIIIPQMKIIHLVRDGRSMVSSALKKLVSIPDPDIYAFRISPPDPTIPHNEWKSMDRFTRLCWIWTTENRFLRETTGLRIRFEDIISDYDAFRKGVLDPTGIVLKKEGWERHAGTPRNSSRRQADLEYSSWPYEKKMIFNTLCGDEMRELGYDSEFFSK